jgi:anaerobic nitric oxide reductase transcription regulator
MLSVNCSSVPESRLETALFAHADGGGSSNRHHTAGLFEMSHGTARCCSTTSRGWDRARRRWLLRALENGDIPQPDQGAAARRSTCGIISATDVDLLERGVGEVVRVDLLYRLNVAHLQFLLSASAARTSRS